MPTVLTKGSANDRSRYNTNEPLSGGYVDRYKPDRYAVGRYQDKLLTAGIGYQKNHYRYPVHSNTIPNTNDYYYPDRYNRPQIQYGRHDNQNVRYGNRNQNVYLDRTRDRNQYADRNRYTNQNVDRNRQRIQYGRQPGLRPVITPAPTRAPTRAPIRRPTPAVTKAPVNDYYRRYQLQYGRDRNVKPLPTPKPTPLSDNGNPLYGSELEGPEEHKDMDRVTAAPHRNQLNGTNFPKLPLGSYDPIACPLKKFF
ncbi:hypothetical protein SNE40_015374 [Patella caerulea]|uniref:Uncharacterized protein n=1 Tax=Patella caerulea TaxID=87958 RepID=A0AAN8PEN5_PATCE